MVASRNCIYIMETGNPKDTIFSHSKLDGKINLTAKATLQAKHVLLSQEKTMRSVELWGSQSIKLL